MNLFWYIILNGSITRHVLVVLNLLCTVYFPYRIYTRLHLVGKPYDFNVVARLMVLAQTVRPVWLLQSKGTLILVCPWHMTSDIYWLNPIKNGFVYQVRSLKIKSYSCIFITQYYNNVQIVIFRDQNWNFTPYLDNKINFLFYLRKQCVSNLAVLAELFILYLFQKKNQKWLSVWPWALASDLQKQWWHLHAKRNICTTNSENGNQSSSACMIFTMNKEIISYADSTFDPRPQIKTPGV